MRSLPADVYSLMVLRSATRPHRPLGEQLRPPAVPPVEQHEAFGVEALAISAASASR